MISFKKYTVTPTFLCIMVLFSYSSQYEHETIVHSDTDKGFIKSISAQIADRLSSLDGIEFRSNINVSYTELGLIESGEKEGHSLTLHFAASLQGNYLIDVIFKTPDSYKGVGMKSVYDGKILSRLMRGGIPILMVSVGEGEENQHVVLSGFNPLLAGLSFIQPSKDSETHPNNRIDWPVVISRSTISRRIAEIIPASIRTTSDNITFQIPGEGILDGRQFDYEVVIALPMGLPSRLSRLSLEDKKPISVYEVVDWKEMRVKDKKIWLPIKVTEEVYNKNGELLMHISSEVTEYIIHKEFSPDFFTIPLSEADLLRDEDNGTTIDLRTKK
jgi:hypothetical protein